MSDQKVKALCNAGIAYAMLALVGTLAVVTHLILSPGNVLGDEVYYGEDIGYLHTPEDNHDTRVFMLWLLWGVALGAVAAAIAALSHAHLVARADEALLKEQREIDRVRTAVDARRYKVEVPWPTRPRTVNIRRSDYGPNWSERWPNSERTHKIALRYNNLRSNP